MARPARPRDEYALDMVEAPDLRGALSRLLFKVAVVDDLPAGWCATFPMSPPSRARATWSGPASPPGARPAGRA
ncbi:MAG: hypothetical protein R2734_12550 [Nocardioides sp.]